MEQCDIICFVYSADDPNSLKYIDSLVENYNIKKIPIISVETKCDTKPDQKYQPPKQISVKNDQDVYLYEFLTKVAADP
jgi:hypothetical protein